MKLLQLPFRFQNVIFCKKKNFIGVCTKSWLRCVSSEAEKSQQNVILMGSPGSGKTTIGRILGQKLNMPVADVDDHHLESHWGMSVAEKLSEIGSDSFVEEEGKALLQFRRQGHVISLTGSNPMHQPAMDYISKTGIVVFIDVKNEDITERLEKMKVNRILGQESGASMSTILQYRQQFYEKAYDIRVICEENERQESIADKIVNEVQHYRNKSGYVSTRDASKNQNSVDFSTALLKGLASDGGLFVPNSNIPKLSLPQWSRLVPLSYQDRAVRILEKWIHPTDLRPQELRYMINKAYSVEHFDNKEIFPVHFLKDNQYLLELFHGPTSSFKDAALQLMPQFFHHALKTNADNSQYVILVATSGDTGGAVLDGFSRHAAESGVSVIVLFPEDGISEVQKKQMTSIQSDNVHVIGVNGDFDDCQSYVKRAFQDFDLTKMLLKDFNCRLSAANSISWGRLVPQIVFHASAYLDLVNKKVISLGEEIDICIPTGNFGNILAAYYVKEMGIPVKRLICSSNGNNVLTEFLTTGRYDLQNRQLIKTTSPAIDILVSSNLERYLYHASSRNASLVASCFDALKAQKYFEVPKELQETIKSTFTADWCNEDDAKRTIKEVLKDTGYMLDPHTAVAMTVADRERNDNRPMIIASTAHCDKFAPEIMSFLNYSGKKDLQSMFKSLQDVRSYPAPHRILEDSMRHSTVHKTVIDAKYDNVVQHIVSFSKKISTF